VLDPAVRLDFSERVFNPTCMTGSGVEVAQHHSVAVQAARGSGE
jgi:hypothetical protein